MTNDERIKKAESLAYKLDKLNSHFDVTTSTIHEIAEYVEDMPEDEEVEKDTELLSMSMLKSDFKMIRNTLLDTIKNGKKVISNLTTELLQLEGNSGSAISAYAELIMTVNSSMKLLTETYSNIIKLQKEMSEKNIDKKDISEDKYLGVNVTAIIRETKKINTESVYIENIEQN